MAGIDTPLMRVAERAVNDPDFFNRLKADRAGALLEAGLDVPDPEDLAALDAALAGELVVRFDFTSWIESVHEAIAIGATRLPSPPRWPGMWPGLVPRGLGQPGYPRVKAKKPKPGKTKRGASSRTKRSTAKGRTTKRKHK